MYPIVSKVHSLHDKARAKLTWIVQGVPVFHHDPTCLNVDIYPLQQLLRYYYYYDLLRQ